MAAGQIVFESRRFAVRRREVVVGGETRTYDIVDHPGAAIILPVLADGRVVLIGNHRVAVERELLELPAGCIDAGESAAETARRELMEETGYRAERMEPLVWFYSTPGVFTEAMHVFVARGLKEGAAALEAGEQIRLQPMGYEEALDAVRDGRIVDGKTIVALLYYDRFVRGKGNG